MAEVLPIMIMAAILFFVLMLVNLFKFRNYIWRKKNSYITSAEIIKIVPTDTMIMQHREYILELRYVDENGFKIYEDISVFCYKPIQLETKYDMLDVSVVRDKDYRKGMKYSSFKEYAKRCPENWTEKKKKVIYNSIISSDKIKISTILFYPAVYVERVKLAKPKQIGERKKPDMSGFWFWFCFLILLVSLLVIIQLYKGHL